MKINAFEEEFYWINFQLLYLNKCIFIQEIFYYDILYGRINGN